MDTRSRFFKSRKRNRPRRRRGGSLVTRVALSAAPLLVLVVVGILGAGTLIYGTLSHQLDNRLANGWTLPPATVVGAPLEFSVGLAIGRDDFTEWLDNLGYAERHQVRRIGDFMTADETVTFMELHGDHLGRTVHVTFTHDSEGTPRISTIAFPPGADTDRLSLGPPILSTLYGADRLKRRMTPLSEIPSNIVNAVLAAEDHRFFRHHGVDAVRILGALVTNLTGKRPYLVGASTLTQQLIKNTLLTPERTMSRKLHEQALALLLERRLPKARILELYLNDVYLGHHQTFAVHGVAQGARALFGKDLWNLTLGEAATMAGLIQAPQTTTPSRHPERAQQRRNGVLQAMVELKMVTPEQALAAARESIRPSNDFNEKEAPYFVDFVVQRLDPSLAEPGPGSTNLRVETTLDLHLQRMAESAVQEGLRRITSQRSTTPEVALVAMNPQTGAVLALVGGRSYTDSQFNRAERARRQPGSVVKPFVYLAALESGQRDAGAEFTAATLIDDSPTTFTIDQRPWRPRNYGHEYDGAITPRMALAHSRNVAAVKVAQQAGLETVANLWAAASGNPPPPAYPSIALGAFESSPLGVAAAYATLANGGVRPPLHAIRRIIDGDRVIEHSQPSPERVTSAEHAFLVSWMLQSTLDHGTAAEARRAGFMHDAAGKTGTTDDFRDAWFAGFTPNLLAVVWVGMDDASPLGLTGAQAALPIWTDFMKQALDGRPPGEFRPPAGIQFVEVDPVTGLRATPSCPAPLPEAFLQGTAPTEYCHLH